MFEREFEKKHMHHPICKVIVLALATFILALLMETFWNKKAADICGNLGEVPDSQTLAHLLLGWRRSMNKTNILWKQTNDIGKSPLKQQEIHLEMEDFPLSC